jgi:hypothetical protein
MRKGWSLRPRPWWKGGCAALSHAARYAPRPAARFELGIGGSRSAENRWCRPGHVHQPRLESVGADRPQGGSEGRGQDDRSLTHLGRIRHGRKLKALLSAPHGAVRRPRVRCDGLACRRGNCVPSVRYHRRRGLRGALHGTHRTRRYGPHGTGRGPLRGAHRRRNEVRCVANGPGGGSTDLPRLALDRTDNRLHGPGNGRERVTAGGDGWRFFLDGSSLATRSRSPVQEQSRAPAAARWPAPPRAQASREQPPVGRPRRRAPPLPPRRRARRSSRTSAHRRPRKRRRARRRQQPRRRPRSTAATPNALERA